jgi:hypothetical protein
MPADTPRRNAAVSLQEAARASPALARLVSLVRDSSERLDAIRPLVPPGMRAALQAGPLEDGLWCLLVRGNAAASKLRQLLPALEAHLRTRGLPVRGIRIKVQADWRT